MSSDDIDRVAAQLSEVLASSHGAILAVHGIAEAATSAAVKLECLRAAARMMQAQAAVAVSLKRLTSDESRYAFRYIHEGLPPTPKKSKTNGRALNGHAQAQHGA